jgi:hypothetical protein
LEHKRLIGLELVVPNQPPCIVIQQPLPYIVILTLSSPEGKDLLFASITDPHHP